MFSSGNLMNARLLQQLAQRMPQGAPGAQQPGGATPPPQLPGARDPRFMQSLTGLMNFLRQRQGAAAPISPMMPSPSTSQSPPNEIMDALMRMREMRMQRRQPQDPVPAPRQESRLPDFYNNLLRQPSREELRQQQGPYVPPDVNAHGSKAVTIYGKFGPHVVYESSPGRYTDQMGMPLVGITPDMLTPPPGGYPTKGQPPAMGQMGQPDAMQPPPMTQTGAMAQMGAPQMSNNFAVPLPLMALSSGNLATPAAMQRLGVADMMRNAGMMNQPAQMAPQAGLAPNEQMFARGGFAVKRAC